VKIRNQVVLLGIVVNAYNPSYSGGRGKRIINSRPALAKLVRSYLKTKIKGLEAYFKW
jgi:hypothetical protein